jgi:hypothetical protein
MSRKDKLREIEELRASLRRLESELAESTPSEEAQPSQPPYYAAYHILAGFVLGMFGAATSLLFNIVGSLLYGHHPLQLIQVYLTFPLGESALNMDSGVALAIGCCLYLGTGMLLGIPFQLLLTRWLPKASFAVRFAGVGALALAFWLFNYYAILSWLQPLLFGGRWIIELIPPWVAALTHLVFGWTLLVVQPLGTFTPYRLLTKE